jgi:hypothetical protein
VSFQDGYLLAEDTGGQETFTSTTTVFRASDLTRLWSVDTTAGGLAPCGPVTCLQSLSGISGLDPDTGRELWTQPGERGARAVGTDRLLLSQMTDNGDNVLVEASTGRTIGEPTAGQVLWNVAEHGSVLVLRHTRQPADKVSVTRLNLTTGATRVLGVIDLVIEPTCWDLERYLACPIQNKLVVTAVG